MHVYLATPELSPDGLAEKAPSLTGISDFSAGLSRSLAAAGVEVTTIAPFRKSFAAESCGLARRLTRVSIELGDTTVSGRVWEATATPRNLNGVFIELDEPWTLPSTEQSNIDGDHVGRASYAFCAAVSDLAKRSKTHVDLIHGVGWPSAWLAIFRELANEQCTASDRALAQRPVVITLTDLHDYPTHPQALLDELRIDRRLFTMDGLEYFGRISPMKAAVRFANATTITSSSLVQQMTTEQYAGDLHGFYRANSSRVHGIPSGPPPESEPSTADSKPSIQQDITAKQRAKQALGKALDLPCSRRIPLIVAYAPFDEQAGADLLVDCLEELLDAKQAAIELHMLLIGPSDGPFATRIAELCRLHGDKLRLLSLADGDRHHALLAADAAIFAHRTQRGSLNVYPALAKASIPIAHALGTLRDTIVDFDRGSTTGHGILFSEDTPDALKQAVRRFIQIFRDKDALLAIRKNALTQKVDWTRATCQYQQLYQRIWENQMPTSE